MHFLRLRVILSRLKAIRFMMADKTVPKTKKAIIIAGIAYLFLPIDLIPPELPLIGLLDDLVLWIFILWYLSSELDKYWVGDTSKDYSAKFRGKTVVDDVEYEVDEPGQSDGEDTESVDDESVSDQGAESEEDNQNEQ